MSIAKYFWDLNKGHLRKQGKSLRIPDILNLRGVCLPFFPVVTNPKNYSP